LAEEPAPLWSDAGQIGFRSYYGKLNPLRKDRFGCPVVGQRISSRGIRMALYRLEMTVLSRSKGRSSIASAAYQSGTKLHDERTGQTSNFIGKKVAATGMIYPFEPGQAKWDTNSREALWNKAEAAERRKNSIVARSIKLALSHENSLEENLEAVEKFCKYLADRYKVAVDFAIHTDHKTGGDPRNVHSHILMTTREVSPEGLGDKTRILDAKATAKKELKEIRATWAQIQNESLKKAGRSERVDHKSYKDQGVDKVPGVHMGAKATYLERKGIRTIKGDKNRLAQDINELSRFVNSLDANLDNKAEATIEAFGLGESSIELKLLEDSILELEQKQRKKEDLEKKVMIAEAEEAELSKRWDEAKQELAQVSSMKNLITLGIEKKKKKEKVEHSKRLWQKAFDILNEIRRKIYLISSEIIELTKSISLVRESIRKKIDAVKEHLFPQKKVKEIKQALQPQTNPEPQTDKAPKSKRRLRM
jgi:hypothetical protein